MRSFCLGSQQSTSSVEQQHDPSSSQDPQLHTAAANSPFPPRFFQPNCLQIPRLPTCSVLLTITSPLPQPYPSFEICLVVSFFCNSLSTVVLFLSPDLQFLDLKKKITHKKRKPGLKMLKHKFWIFPAKLFLKPDATNWQFFKQFI